MSNWNQKERKESIGASGKFENIMTKNNSTLVADTKPQVHRVQRTPTRINTKITTYGNITFKLLKTKDNEKIMKTVREVIEVIRMGRIRI